jgi:hypothetical protein
MVGGGVAAAEFWEPYASTLLKTLKGSKVLADSKEDYWTKQALIADAVFMNSDFIDKRHDVALKTMKAALRRHRLVEKEPGGRERHHCQGHGGKGSATGQGQDR